MVEGEMMKSITLTLPYPISANRYWRTFMPKGFKAPVTTLSSEAKAYKEQVGWLVKAAGIRAPIAGRVAVSYVLYPHRPQDWQKRMRTLGSTWDDGVQCIDLDNAQKVLFDSLKNLAFEDDKWVRRITAERAEPDGEARVVVTITEIPLELPQAALFDALPA
jgi:crossover junction endodeoxyribonuclease RusA